MEGRQLQKLRLYMFPIQFRCGACDLHLIINSLYVYIVYVVCIYVVKYACMFVVLFTRYYVPMFNDHIFFQSIFLL